MKRLLPVVAALLATVAMTLPAAAESDLRLNELQVMGTHNSYRERSVWPLALIVRLWDYGHAPLDLQFEYEGVRKLELDVYVGPGGQFILQHVPIVDNQVSCSLFTACLELIETWSDANPNHAPIFLMIEPKDSLAVTKVSDRYPQFDEAIRSVMDPGDLITPDDVRGAHPDLATAIATDGWPTLDWARGRVMFFLNAGGDTRDKYVGDDPTLAGKVAFPEADVDSPYAAVFVRNNPIASFDEIQQLVSDGYIVRTRADDDVRLEPAQSQAALDSGAQILSTDFPSPGHLASGSGYFGIPGMVAARCNPVNAPGDCVDADAEDGVFVPKPQTVTVAAGGSTATATVAADTFVYGPPGTAMAQQLTGNATIDDGANEIAVNVSATSLLGLPLYIGRVSYTNVTTGQSFSGTLVPGQIRRTGDNGVTATLRGFSPGIPFKTGSVSITITE